MYELENKGKGILGAILGSLAGAVIFFILYKLGYLAAICGAVGVVAAITLYKKFAGSISKFGIIFSLVISLIILLIAYYVTLGILLYEAWIDYGYSYSLMDALWTVPYLFTEEGGGFGSELIMIVVFWAIGGIPIAIKSLRSAKTYSSNTNFVESTKISESNSSMLDEENKENDSKIE